MENTNSIHMYLSLDNWLVHGKWFILIGKIWLKAVSSVLKIILNQRKKCNANKRRQNIQHFQKLLCMIIAHQNFQHYT